MGVKAIQHLFDYPSVSFFLCLPPVHHLVCYCFMCVLIAQISSLYHSSPFSPFLLFPSSYSSPLSSRLKTLPRSFIRRPRYANSLKVSKRLFSPLCDRYAAPKKSSSIEWFDASCMQYNMNNSPCKYSTFSSHNPTPTCTISQPHQEHAFRKVTCFLEIKEIGRQWLLVAADRGIM